jgi:hypothetical protein
MMVECNRHFGNWGRRVAAAPIRLTNQPARPIAFSLGQEVVVPFAVRVRAEIRQLSRLSDHTDIHFATGKAIDRVERLQFGVDLLDRQFTSDLPSVGHVSDVGYVFVRAKPIWFRHAVDVVFFQLNSLVRFPVRVLYSGRVDLR